MTAAQQGKPTWWSPITWGVLAEVPPAHLQRRGVYHALLVAEGARDGVLGNGGLAG